MNDVSETTLVEAGDSSEAVFSPDGRRLLFVSRGRPGHSQAQVYEKDLSTGQELRITFQNGDTSFPRYHPRDGWILYSSGTDELKESPPLLKPTTANPNIPAAFQGQSEIYLHSLKGLEITRLTHFPGYDGDARFSHDGKIITWTRAKDEKLEVLALRQGSSLPGPVKKLGVNPTQYLPSPDNKWRAWVDWDASFGVAKLMLRKGGTQPIELVPEMVVPKTDLYFSPDSKWLLWSQLNSDTSTHQLWSFQLETNCARRLTDNSDGDRRHPTISPDMQRLVYSVQRKDRSRIAITAFRPPTGPCVTPP